jgi:hypothetical protein
VKNRNRSEAQVNGGIKGLIVGLIFGCFTAWYRWNGSTADALWTLGSLSVACFISSYITDRVRQLR